MSAGVSGSLPGAQPPSAPAAAGAARSAGGAPAAAPSAGAQPGPLADADVHKGVAKLCASLRKSHAATAAAAAAAAAADNAARLREMLQRQAEERQRLLPPAAWDRLQRCPLPRVAARGTGAAAWDAPRAAAEQRRLQLQAAAGGPGGHPAGEGSRDVSAGSGDEGGEGPERVARSVRPFPPQPLAATRSVINTVGGKSVPLQAFVLPTCEAVPPYKTWIHLTRNCVSRETGKRMFYTDDKGETVPVSEDEADVEAAADRQVLLGTLRQRTDALLRGVTQRFGTGPAVFAALQQRLGVSAAALEARVAALAAQGEGLEPPPEPRWADKAERVEALERDMHSSWCRRCRVFGCRLHPGAHLRPVTGPDAEPAPPAQVGQAPPAPCGPRCHLAQGGGDVGGGSGGSDGQPSGGVDGSVGGDADSAVEPGGGGGLGRPPSQRAADSLDGGQRQQQQQQGVGGEEGAVPTEVEGVVSMEERAGGREQPSFASSPAPLPGRQAGRRRRAGPPAGEPPAGSGPASEQPWAAEHEVTSPPAKQPRWLDASSALPSGSTAAAAAAAAAAAHVPARRRRGSGSSGGSMAPDQSSGAAAAQPKPDDAPWTQWEDGLLLQGLEVWGHQPCKVATLVGSRSCAAVALRAAQLGGGGGAAAARDDAGQLVQRRGRGRKMAKAQVRPRKPVAVYERSKRPTNEMWPQFTPCACVGPCRPDCPCAADANFCEKYCACDPAKCVNRFQGCTCKCGDATAGERCSTKRCPCLAAGRECDPDLCRGCKPTLTGSHREGWQCNNFRLRLGQRKRVLMGLSEVQGWGAFVQQPAAKDEFVGEYCGELISHAEADRRGMVYDRDDNSYLFNLNLDWVIDARQRGNTLRFANHSANANCRAQILMVDGDHRVAIVANRPLAAGEELFYNYNYDRRVAPDWAVNLQQQREAVRGPAKKQAARRGGRAAAPAGAAAAGAGGGGEAATSDSDSE